MPGFSRVISAGFRLYSISSMRIVFRTESLAPDGVLPSAPPLPPPAQPTATESATIAATNHATLGSTDAPRSFMGLYSSFFMGRREGGHRPACNARQFTAGRG